MLMRIIIINKIKVKFFYSSILCKDTKKTYMNTSIRMIVNVVLNLMIIEKVTRLINSV